MVFNLILIYFRIKSGYKHKLHVAQTSSTKIKDFQKLSIVTPMGFHTFFFKISEILNFTFLRFILVIIAIFRRKNGKNREILHILTILKFRECALEENLHFYGFHETCFSKSIAHLKIINACFIPLMPKLTILERF